MIKNYVIKAAKEKGITDSSSRIYKEIEKLWNKVIACKN